MPRREHFEKTSIYYAASPAEAALCHGDPVVIVGGGNSAGQATVFLARYAGSVTLVVVEDDLSEHMSRYLISQIEGRAGVRVLCHSQVSELTGDQMLDGVVITDRHTGERSTVPARSMFVFVGTAPCTGWLGGLAALDDQGFVRTGPNAGRPRPARTGTPPDPSWRPASPACSRPATSAAARPGAWPPPSATGPWPSAWPSSGCRRARPGDPRPGGPAPARHDSQQQEEEITMPVLGFTMFERLFREAGGVDVDRDDIKRYLDFVSDAIYDLLITARATARANARDIVEPHDLPVTRGLQEAVRDYHKISQDVGLDPVLADIAARPPLDISLSDDTASGLPALFGGISVQLARLFRLTSGQHRAVHAREWDRAFAAFRLLV